ncbi:MAG TPA: hypothetical protein VMW50_14885 [Dehalococcoidia bacterium]|nr:hypothetical protein [Dehalococcoidia bacterium]
MVNQVVNGLIASVIGAVAFIAVKAMVGGSIYGVNSNAAYNSSTATAGELMIHDILPLAIAIMVVAGLFMGLTRVKGA